MPRSRSFTGNHDLLPAVNRNAVAYIPHVPVRSISSWTFGTGTVIWRIWPAVLLHTTFAAIIVVISKRTQIHLGIPNVLLTLLGLVIGFVISYRASSGYERYWWGRCAWSDIVKTTRAMSRLVWIHVPPRITKSSDTSDFKFPPEEVVQVMREKRLALDLIEGFAVAMKHHLRGELGIYYEDLYPLVRPLHEHHAFRRVPRLYDTKGRSVGRQGSAEFISQRQAPKRKTTLEVPKPISLPNGANGTDYATPTPFSAGPLSGPHLRHMESHASLVSVSSSEREPLLPASLPGPQSGPSTDLVPFTTILGKLGRMLNPFHWIRTWRANWRKGFEGNDEAGGVGNRWGDPENYPDEEPEEGQATGAEVAHGNGLLRHRSARQTHNEPGKHRPRVAGDGENLPLEILKCLSEWLSVLEARGTVGGNALGGMFGCVTSFEDYLSTLERILTTPLPFVYSVHISTVWIYLFFLPFQLVNDFHWYTIPGTAVAAFFYLGFLAAGEEIEQPFGYDENDLDLDLFCHELIHPELHTLTMTPFPNAPMGSHRLDPDVNEASTVAELASSRRRQE